MKRSFPWILMLIFIATACSPGPDSELPIPPSPESTIGVAEVLETVIDQSTDAPTEGVPTPAPTESFDEPTATPVIEMLEKVTAEPTASTVPTPEEEFVFNGPYENTYFRGSATAPVTMIDYSDFL